MVEVKNTRHPTSDYVIVDFYSELWGNYWYIGYRLLIMEDVTTLVIIFGTHLIDTITLILELGPIKLESRKYFWWPMKCILASWTYCWFYIWNGLAMIVSLPIIFVLTFFYNTLFSFYIIFTASFGWLAVAVGLGPLQGSLRRHFLALVCSNWFNSFKWEDSLPIKTSPLALGKHHKLSFLSTSLAFSLYYDKITDLWIQSCCCKIRKTIKQLM